MSGNSKIRDSLIQSTDWTDVCSAEPAGKKASNLLLIVLSFSPVNRQTDTHKEGDTVLDELPPLSSHVLRISITEPRNARLMAACTCLLSLI